MIKFFNSLFLAGDGDLTTLLLLGGAGVMLLLFFVFNSRSSKKRAKQLSDNIKLGAKVMSNGGIVGEVVELTDTEIVLKTVYEENAAYVRFVRQAIGFVYPENAVANGESKEEEVYNEIK